jgi:hypothetical protein
VEAAGDDARKRKKLEDEFTPSLEMAVVGLEGKVHREVTTQVQYRLGDGPAYSSQLIVVPHTATCLNAPDISRCGKTGRTAPRECFERCELSGISVLRHVLVRSDISGRQALSDHTISCSLSGKRILIDEAEVSAISGKPVATSLLKTCAMTGKRAEPEHFGRCDFTRTDVLNSELGISEVSGKRYRVDQKLSSVVSNKVGHKEEFVHCHETRQPMLAAEGQQCEVTGKFVRPGVLEQCAETGKSVLPSELERCSLTDERVLKKLLVTSSESGARLLKGRAVRSAAGKYCAPTEAKICTWSSRRSHPDDLRTCTLTGIPFHFEFASPGERVYLQPLADLLHGVRRTTEAPDYWEDITSKTSTALRGGRCRVETAHLSPDMRHLAVCSEVRTLLGFRVHQAGLLYSLEDGSIVGRVATGKRTATGWAAATS